MSKHFSALLITVAIGLSLSACGTNPVTKKQSFSLYLKTKKSPLVKKITPLPANRKAVITLLTPS